MLKKKNQAEIQFPNKRKEISEKNPFCAMLFWCNIHAIWNDAVPISFRVAF